MFRQCFKLLSCVRKIGTNPWRCPVSAGFSLATARRGNEVESSMKMAKYKIEQHDIATPSQPPPMNGQAFSPR